MSDITAEQARKISDVPAVHEALFNFSHDSTEDNAVGVIQAVAEALSAPRVPEGFLHNGREMLRRLGEHYDFEGEGGPLRNCVEYLDLVRYFEQLQQAATTAPDTDELDRLRERVAELEKDAARLDWVEKNRANVLVRRGMDPRLNLPVMFEVSGGEVTHSGYRLREAIDNARLREGGE